jgi:hypothetical protein
MRYAATVLCAAAVSGLSVGAVNAADKAPTTAPSVVHTVSTAANSTANAMTKAANTIASAAAQSPDSAMRNLFAKAANQAVAGSISGVVLTLDSSSQQRINSAMPKGQTTDATLNLQVQTLNKNWKQKYGHAFSITNADSTFANSYAGIQRGSPTKDTQLAASIAKIDGYGAVTTSTFAGDSSIALATITSGKILPQTQIPLACEKDGHWRIDAPASLTYDNLRRNLTAQLSDANQHVAQWPANEADAQGIIAHHVLMAVMNQSAPAPAKAAALAPKTSTMTPTPHQATVSARPTAAPVSTTRWWQFWKW